MRNVTVSADQGKRKYCNEEGTMLNLAADWIWGTLGETFRSPTVLSSIRLVKCKNARTSIILGCEKISKHFKVSVRWKGKGNMWSNMHMTIRYGKPNDRNHSLSVLLKLLVSILGGCFHFYHSHYFCCYGLIFASCMKKFQMKTSRFKWECLISIFIIKIFDIKHKQPYFLSWRWHFTVDINKI